MFEYLQTFFSQEQKNRICAKMTAQYIFMSLYEFTNVKYRARIPYKIHENIVRFEIIRAEGPSYRIFNIK